MGSAIENGGEKGFLNNMTKIISGFGGSISIFLLHFKANWDLESIGAFNRVSVRAQECWRVWQFWILGAYEPRRWTMVIWNSGILGSKESVMFGA